MRTHRMTIEVDCPEFIDPFRWDWTGAVPHQHRDCGIVKVRVINDHDFPANRAPAPEPGYVCEGAPYINVEAMNIEPADPEYDWRAAPDTYHDGGDPFAPEGG